MTDLQHSPAPGLNRRRSDRSTGSALVRPAPMLAGWDGTAGEGFDFGQHQVCGMDYGGVPMPAGRSGMLGSFTGAADSRDVIVEQRVGEVQTRVAESAANRSGTASSKPVKRPRV